MTQELIDRLREDYCSCIDGYKSRGMTDPQCSSCDSKDWREECADALVSLTAERDALKVKADKWQALAYQARKELAIIQGEKHDL